MIKGTQVAVSGEAFEDHWEKDGVKQSRVKVNANEIQLLGGKSQDKPTDKPRGDLGYGTTPASHQSKPAQQPEFDDQYPTF